jgi:nitroreductase
MVKGSAVRHAAYAIDELFVDRWSPRAMSGEDIAESELMVLFEAARWAPSSFNLQPWRMLYARRVSPKWPLFVNLLTESNQVWATKAAMLVVFISRKTHPKSGHPLVTHSYDTGAAWANFALQGFLKGYVVHGMQGFDYARAQQELRIPADFRVEAMAAVGKPAPKETLPTALQQRETPNDRRPLTETVCEGLWALSG